MKSNRIGFIWKMPIVHGFSQLQSLSQSSRTPTKMTGMCIFFLKILSFTLYIKCKAYNGQRLLLRLQSLTGTTSENCQTGREEANFPKPWKHLLHTGFQLPSHSLLPGWSGTRQSVLWASHTLMYQNIFAECYRCKSSKKPLKTLHTYRTGERREGSYMAF